MPRRTFPLRAPLVAMLLFLGLAVGCDSDSAVSGLNGNSIVTLTLDGLQPLTGGMNYQAWLVTQTDNNLVGEPVVIFNVDDQGRMVHATADTLISGPFPSSTPAASVLGVAVSLERSTQLESYSSSSFVLSGEMAGGSAVLTVGDWLALNQDFSNIGGSFILSTPTDQDETNELSGVWFVDPNTNPESASVDLPESTSGWIYEGWVEVGGQALSMGRFTTANLPDSASAFSGPEDPPPFPGEDFLVKPPTGLTFPLDLSGASVFITAEPGSDSDPDSDQPFFLRLLEGQVPLEPVTLTAYDLTNLTNQFPTGTATVQDIS
jgi:hypothetical protein